MISARLLRQWRRDSLEALHSNGSPTSSAPGEFNIDILQFNELNQRILRLTQELLDQNLMTRGKS